MSSAFLTCFSSHKGWKSQCAKGLPGGCKNDKNHSNKVDTTRKSLFTRCTLLRSVVLGRSRTRAGWAAAHSLLWNHRGDIWPRAASCWDPQGGLTEPLPIACSVEVTERPVDIHACTPRSSPSPQDQPTVCCPAPLLTEVGARQQRQQALAKRVHAKKSSELWDV